jgi:hypothetical protein
MDEVFTQQFGPQGPMPLREPLRHEVEEFYANVKLTNAHDAIGKLMAKLADVPPAELDGLKLTILRRGQAYLLSFINHDPGEPDTTKPLTIKLENMITSFNGTEAWESLTLDEPTFLQFKEYYAKFETAGEDAAMQWLMSELSGVNAFALKKLPITRYVEAESYLRAFLSFFPKTDVGKTS